MFSAGEEEVRREHIDVGRRNRKAETAAGRKEKEFNSHVEGQAQKLEQLKNDFEPK